MVRFEKGTRYDCHIHINDPGEPRPDELMNNLNQAGLMGGVLLSQHPPIKGEPFTTALQRMEHALGWTRGKDSLFPFYFIDPVSSEGIQEVDLAVSLGFKGFKVMATNHYPCDERALKVYERIAYHNRPILFHSGILYDGNNPSGQYNRPFLFEGLLKVEGLRFALAHMSWPWTDECIALFGKAQDASRHWTGHYASTARMFIDLTPGTPAVFRDDAIHKLLFSGYKVKEFILWGSDLTCEAYNSQQAKNLYSDDVTRFEKGLDPQDTQALFCDNLKRFLEG